VGLDVDFGFAERLFNDNGHFLHHVECWQDSLTEAEKMERQKVEQEEHDVGS